MFASRTLTADFKQVTVLLIRFPYCLLIGHWFARCQQHMSRWCYLVCLYLLSWLLTLNRSLFQFFVFCFVLFVNWTLICLMSAEFVHWGYDSGTMSADFQQVTVLICLYFTVLLIQWTQQKMISCPRFRPRIGSLHDKCSDKWTDCMTNVYLIAMAQWHHTKLILCIYVTSDKGYHSLCIFMFMYLCFWFYYCGV